jgi:hypothetical protein
MSFKLLTSALAFTLAFSGAALAQNSSPDCAQTKALKAQSSPMSSSATSMAATSSDQGKMGPGASSDAMGTGKTDKTGVNNPCVPGTTGNGATGALPGKMGTP